MALFVPGMVCPICGRPMHAEQELVGFSPLVSNQADPLWFFSDGVFHAVCFREHPLAEHVNTRVREILDHTADRPPVCAICKRRITDPDDHFTFGHLTQDKQNPLSGFNYLQLHKSCIRGWSELSRVRSLLEELRNSGRWVGPALDFMLSEIEQAAEKGKQ